MIHKIEDPHFAPRFFFRNKLKPHFLYHQRFLLHFYRRNDFFRNESDDISSHRHLLGVALHAGNFLNGGTPFLGTSFEELGRGSVESERVVVGFFLTLFWLGCCFPGT